MPAGTELLRTYEGSSVPFGDACRQAAGFPSPRIGQRTRTSRESNGTNRQKRRDNMRDGMPPARQSRVIGIVLPASSAAVTTTVATATRRALTTRLGLVHLDAAPLEFGPRELLDRGLSLLLLGHFDKPEAL